MHPPRSLSKSWAGPLLAVILFFNFVSSEYVPFLQPGFFFDYDIPGQPVPIPITRQCETIHITWGRRNAIGPNPTAPYVLQVYTSTFTTPFIIPAGNGLKFDWDVPFAPDTQYQICMFDSNGIAGGCQAMYTVVQNTTVATPSCQNVTFPAPLNVQGTVANGPMSQYGFVDQCTDIALTPINGQPPFTLTVAPSLHPPYNISSGSFDPIIWTVSLSWSFPFFLSLVSADGLVWSNGPMHAGGFGPSDCLAPGTIPKSKSRATALGAGIGSLVAGVLLGILSAWLGRKRRRSGKPPDSVESSTTGITQFKSDLNTSSSDVPVLPGGTQIPVPLEDTSLSRPANEITPVRIRIPDQAITSPARSSPSTIFKSGLPPNPRRPTRARRGITSQSAVSEEPPPDYV